MSRQKIKVLIVEDSLVFRTVLAKGLASDPALEIVGTAGDPFVARDMILEYEPDVMTCDVEMPRMNGIEFIKRLLPQYPLPVIVISSLNDVVFDALKAGAIDFVAKPDVSSAQDVKTFLENTISKVKIAATAKVMQEDGNQLLDIVKERPSVEGGQIIAIGASTGGTQAIFRVLQHLPQNSPGIVITQHIPAGFSRMFAERLDNTTNLTVKEAKDGDLLKSGTVLVAPGELQMRVKRFNDIYKVECWRGEKVNGHAPSVDVLFESVAKEAGSKAVGIILTGMGYDGARGLLTMKRKGARTIGQDEKTSVVYGMPKVAYDLGAVEKQLPLDDIPQAVYSIIAKGSRYG